MTRHLTWPAERFYWCVLEAPGWTRGGVPPPGVQQRLEDELPVPRADLHAVATPLAGGRLLVCAARRDELEGVHELSLTADTVPEFAAGSDLQRLNLLVGEFEPAPVRHTRMRTHTLGAVAVLACGLVVAGGLLRRAFWWSNEAAVLEERIAELTPPEGLDALTHQIAIARAAAAITSRDSEPDAAMALGAVLAGWPSSVKCSAQSIAVDRSGASISVTVEGDPEPFLSALRPPPGWHLDEPRLVNAGSVNRVTLKLRPEGGGT